jgi:hypothetical protein
MTFLRFCLNFAGRIVYIWRIDVNCFDETVRGVGNKVCICNMDYFIFLCVE